jgi:putative RNA 2'-phosphotransferase
MDYYFETLWKEIKKECAWENMPENLCREIIPYVGVEEAKEMIRALEKFTKKIMDEDAGDIGDERWRLANAITIVLSQVKVNISPHLYDMKPWALGYTNKIIDDILEKRKNKMTEAEATKISKFLSLVLRHKPEEIGLTMDKNGWVNVRELLEKSKAHGNNFTFEQLQYVVDNNAKKRFAFSDNLENIRASQGHSVEIDLGKKAVRPPEFLFHGTAQQHEEKILATGILKMDRQHVHLSVDVQTAITVGRRHGKPIVFVVAAGEMYGQHDFFLSDNGVWLTDFVPAEFIRKYNSGSDRE